MRGALNLNAKKLALFRQFSTGLFGTKNTNGWLHMCRRPSVLKQGAGDVVLSREPGVSLVL